MDLNAYAYTLRIMRKMTLYAYNCNGNQIETLTFYFVFSVFCDQETQFMSRSFPPLAIKGVK